MPLTAPHSVCSEPSYAAGGREAGHAAATHLQNDNALLHSAHRLSRDAGSRACRPGGLVRLLRHALWQRHDELGHLRRRRAQLAGYPVLGPAGWPVWSAGRLGSWNSSLQQGRTFTARFWPRRWHLSAAWSLHSFAIVRVCSAHLQLMSKLPGSKQRRHSSEHDRLLGSCRVWCHIAARLRAHSEHAFHHTSRMITSVAQVRLSPSEPTLVLHSSTLACVQVARSAQTRLVLAASCRSLLLCTGEGERPGTPVGICQACRESARHAWSQARQGCRHEPTELCSNK